MRNHAAVQTEAIALQAESTAKRDAGRVVGGTALGAIIGGIAGGGSGAGVGALIGGGTGTVAAVATKGKDMQLDSEVEIVFQLAVPVAISGRWGGVKTASPAMTLLAATLALAAGSVSAQTPPSGLGGTSWQLVAFQGGDDTTLTPDDRAKYTIEFRSDGDLFARIDCNRGRGSWTSSGASQLQFGPLALTRAQCPPGSLHDRIVKDWSYVRSYVTKDGHLFLSLMADGGIYEFEPIAGAPSRSIESPVASTGPVTYECRQADGAIDTLTATFYKVQPAMVLVERATQARPAFSVPAASGARYEGRDIRFWEARGEVTVTWSGVELICKKR